MDRVFTEIQRVVRAIVQTERRNVANYVRRMSDDPMPDEAVMAKGPGVGELAALLDPACKTAFDNGWDPDEIFKRRKQLYRAVASLPEWRHWPDRYDKKLELANWPRFDQPKPTGTPTEDFTLLLSWVRSALRAFMLMAPADTVPDEPAKASARASAPLPPPQAERGTDEHSPALTDSHRVTGDTNGRKNSGADALTLTPEDVRILKALRETHPVVMTLHDLEAAADVSRRTAGPRITYLIQHGLAVRPRGPRGGVTITPDGLAWLDSHGR